MAGPGPVPTGKRPGTIRRNKPKPPTVLEPAPAPERALPGEWGEGTLRWWSTWVRSPQSSQFAETDWQRLEFVACLIEQYLADPDRALLAEIRLNEERLGATVADRKRLGWELPPPPAADKAPVVRREGIRIVDHQVAG